MWNLGRSLLATSNQLTARARYGVSTDGTVRGCAERCTAPLQIGIRVALQLRCMWYWCGPQPNAPKNSNPYDDGVLWNPPPLGRHLLQCTCPRQSRSGRMHAEYESYNVSGNFDISNSSVTRLNGLHRGRLSASTVSTDHSLRQYSYSFSRNGRRSAWSMQVISIAAVMRQAAIPYLALS